MPQNSAQLDRLRRRLRQAPHDGHAWLALAQLLASAAPGPELNHAIEQALRSLPESRDAWRLAAEVFARQYGSAAALDWLTVCVRDNPELAVPLMVLGDRQRQQQDWSAAADAYRAARRLQPQDAGLANDLGGCLASLWQFDAARECFEEALQQQPGFAEARLNLALLQASRLDTGSALTEVEAVLSDQSLADGTRAAATTLGSILQEQNRLRPAIERAVASGDTKALQQALNQAPEFLCQTDSRSLYLLDRLAKACGSAEAATEEFQASDVSGLALAEAWTQCRQSGERLVAVAAIPGFSADAIPDEIAAATPALRRTLRAIQDRKAHDISLLSSEQGEACLRYWHARLLAATPDRLPGQFKAVANAIGGRYVTPPEAVVGTIRHLLLQLWPSVPAGLPRAIFMYAAITGIHGFGDGNGRLARFLLAWEMEAAGLPPLVVPLSQRADAGRALNLAWTDADLGPMLDNLRASQAAAKRLLKQLAEIERPC